MKGNRAGAGKSSKASLLVVACILLVGVGLIYFKTDLLKTSATRPSGISGLVSVRGSVSLEQLDLSRQEIRAINNAVTAHKATFTQVDMIVDSVGNGDRIEEDTVLVFAVSMKTKGDLEVKSWSRKIERRKMVAQFVDYIRKAAMEYERFQEFPDVKKNFKTLYI